MMNNNSYNNNNNNNSNGDAQGKSDSPNFKNQDSPSRSKKKDERRKFFEVSESVTPKGDGTVLRCRTLKSSENDIPSHVKLEEQIEDVTQAPKKGDRATLQNFENADILTLLRSSPYLALENLSSGYRYYRKNPRVLGNELISGATVAVMQVPESISFAFLANVPPVVGLYGTFFMAVLTGIFGGKPGMISGAAGALAVLQQQITSETGPLRDLPFQTRIEYLFMTMVITGVIQIVLGFLRVGKFIRIVPQTVMLGFFNGLGILIFMGQLPSFTFCPDKPSFSDCTESERQWVSLNTTSTWLLLILVFSSMLVMHFWSRVPMIGKIIPGSLAALVWGTFLDVVIYRIALDIPTRNVGETASLSGEFPAFHFPQLGDNVKWNIIIQFAFQLAMIGLLESMLTLQACDEITNTRPSGFRANQENIAQGIGNLFSGFFGGLGGDAMVGQSTINIVNGARGRVSSTMSGVFIMAILLVAAPGIENIPIGALTGVLFMIVIHTFRWDSILSLLKMTRTDALVVVVTTALAVVTDLAIAVAAGVGLSALAHSWKSGKLVRAETIIYYDKSTGKAIRKRYNIYGTLFFGTVRSFSDLFSPDSDPKEIYVDFTHSLIADHSAVEALQNLVLRYSDIDSHIRLLHLSERSHRRLKGHHAKLQKMGANVDDGGISYQSPRAKATRILSKVSGMIIGKKAVDQVTKPRSENNAFVRTPKQTSTLSDSSRKSPSFHHSPNQDLNGSSPLKGSRISPEFEAQEALEVMDSFSLGESALLESQQGHQTFDQQHRNEQVKETDDIEKGKQSKPYSPSKSSPVLHASGEVDGLRLMSKLRVFGLPSSAIEDSEIIKHEIEDMEDLNGSDDDEIDDEDDNEVESVGTIMHHHEDQIKNV